MMLSDATPCEFHEVRPYNPFSDHWLGDTISAEEHRITGTEAAGAAKTSSSLDFQLSTKL